jgi:hypothetical protein
MISELPLLPADAEADQEALLGLLSEDWDAIPSVLARMLLRRPAYTASQFATDIQALERRGLVSRRYSGRGLWWRRVGEIRRLP